MGWATVASTMAPEAPGYTAVTETWGGTISGYCAIGIERRAKAPAIVVTTAMTIASLGRSTKTDDSTDKLRSTGRSYRGGAHRCAGPDALQALYDDQFSASKTGVDHNARAAFGSGLDPPYRRFPVRNNENVNTFLVGYQRRLRYYDLLLRSSDFNNDSHQLSIDQSSVRIRHGRPRGNRVGRAINGHIDKIYFANLVVDCAVRKAQLDLQTLDVDPFAGLPDVQKFTLTDGTGHIHWILAPNCRQHARARAYSVAFRDVGAADFSRNRGDDVCVAEIDLRCLQIGFCFQNCCLSLLIGRQRLISCDDGARVCFEQFFGAFELNFGQGPCRLGALECSLRLLDRGFERSSFDPVQWRAFFDHIAFPEQYLLKESGNARFHLDAIDRFHAANKLKGWSRGLVVGDDGADWDDCGTGLLAMRGRRDSESAKKRKYDVAHRVLPSAGRGTSTIALSMKPAIALRCNTLIVRALSGEPRLTKRRLAKVYG